MNAQNDSTMGAGNSAAQTDMVWVILAESGVNRFRNCILGEGSTEKEAWVDAYGPEGKKARPRRTYVWAESMKREELADLHWASCN